MNIPIDAIEKYIKMVFQPTDMFVELSHDTYEKPEYIVFLYFNDIDDKYITNPDARDTIRNKEKNLEREIRSDVEKIFSIKTSGLDLNGFAPYKRHGLNINVIQNRTPK